MAHTLNNLRHAFKRSLIVRSFLLLAALLCEHQAYGQDEQSPLLLNGIASYQPFGREQFYVALRTSKLGSSLSELTPFSAGDELELRIIQSQSRRRLVGGWIEKIAINADVATLQEQVENLNELGGLLKGRLRSGDHLKITATNGGIEVILNNLSLGLIENDPALFNVLMLAWIGDVPPSTDFKNGLLAAGNIDENLQQQFSNIQFNSVRAAEIEAQWIDSEEEQPEKEVDTFVASEPVSEKPVSPSPEAASQIVAAIPVTPATPIEINDTPELKNSDSSDAAPEQENSEPASNSTPAPEIQSTDKLNEEQRTPEKQQTAEEQKSVDEPESIAAEQEIPKEDETDISLQTILEGKEYYRSVSRHVNQFVIYPRRAMMKRQEDVIELSIEINKFGELIGSSATNDSRFPTLEKAALRASEAAQPYPAPPESVVIEGTYQFQVNIAFKMQR